MSDNPFRIPLPEAHRVAAWLMARWSMTEANGCAIVGSIARERPDIGDVDLLAPLPLDPAKDQLYDAIAMGLGIIKPPADLWQGGKPPVPQMTGRVVKGLNPGFKSLALVLTGQSGREVPVNIERYTPGPQGNCGWKQIMRTGPEEFGEALLTQWKRVCGTIGTEARGSDKGFWVDKNGVPVPTPTEKHCFHLARCLWIKPQCRGEGTLLAIDWFHPDSAPELKLRAQQALGALGLMHADQAFEHWKLQTVALAGWKG